MTRALIITGDDFGLAEPVNEAIEHAHRHGALTSTSLMIGERAAADAIARARRNPGLSVGLHVAVCEAQPVSRPELLGSLVDARGTLRHPLSALVRLLSPRVRRALELEIRAQFRAFARTGLTLDHVDAHNHMQLHPAVLPIILRVAREYGSPPLRLPYEPLVPSLRAGGLRRSWRRLPWLVMRPWSAYVRWRIRRAGLDCNRYLFGIYDAGGIDLPLLLEYVRHLPPGVSEIHCHPATRRCPEIDRSMPGYGHEAELEALTSPQLMAAITAGHVRLLSGYRALSENNQERP
jgi:hopanoid biosynthesis associated protein HpnK